MVGLRTSFLRARSIPGSDDIPDDRYTRDFEIELAKTLYRIDWALGYTYQKTFEDLNNRFSNLYRNSYSASAGTSIIPQRTYLNVLYSFADLDILLAEGGVTSSAYENKMDISLSSRLWGTSNLSLAYYYFNRSDYVGTFDNMGSHTASLMFNWPYTKELFNHHKFTIMPYLGCYYTQSDEYTDKYRINVTGRIDADYYFEPEKKLGFLAEYREGIDGSDLNQEGEEIRVFTTYHSYVGF